MVGNEDSGREEEGGGEIKKEGDIFRLCAGVCHPSAGISVKNGPNLGEEAKGRKNTLRPPLEKQHLRQPLHSDGPAAASAAQSMAFICALKGADNGIRQAHGVRWRGGWVRGGGGGGAGGG